ncbi:hypothetical protein DFH08DRAFT_831860 [Mycena albidolilacea]|uniref:Uncharacterized protein n=1 Tax=Mycena albidolilacea TaxID=1033008 RepID=A0AAD7F6L2_9AGAR|nr:hypothetical protein DFH08DRAFT_831860 [Mycena albidolilacea]
MTLALTTTSASFFATVIGGFFYGLFFILAILSTALHIQRIMRRNHPSASRGALMRSALQNPMIMASFTLFLTVTARWILDVIDTAYGILESDNPQVYFIAPIRPRAVTGVGLFLASLVICDAMIIYRLWIVWNKSTPVVIFPLFTLLGMIASGIGVTRQLTIMTVGESPFSNGTARWIVTDSIFNLLTNIYSTGLIAYRIHKINTLASSAGLTRVNGGEDLKSVIAILVESSALLSTWIVFEMITYAAKSPLQIFVQVTLGTVSGISFMLINVRVALGWGQINRTTSVGLPPTRIRMETQVDMHVDMPAKDDSDNGYELDAVSKDQI